MSPAARAARSVVIDPESGVAYNTCFVSITYGEDADVADNEIELGSSR